LKPDDLVWREGFAEWIRAATAPELLSSPLADDGRPPTLAGWMTLAGILSLVTGIGGCLTLVGTASGILMIIAGTALLGARSALSNVTSVDPALRPFFSGLKRFVQMIAWALILGLVSAVFFAFFYFGLFAGLLTGLGDR
jgi:hypothetical protein